MTLNIGAFDPALIGPSWQRELMPDGIIELVAHRFQVPVWKLKSRQRSQHIAFVRQIAMYLLRQCTDLSFPAIGELFERDHSTCVHARNVIAGRMARESAFAALIEGLKGECR